MPCGRRTFRPSLATVRIPKIPGICIAPGYVAEELLRAEGFTDVRYVDVGGGVPSAELLARGELDFAINFVAAYLPLVDASEPVSILAGVHPGCFELFAVPEIDRVADLKGRTVGVPFLGSAQHLFLASIATYVGLDPAKDIDWVTSAAPKPMQLFAEGRIEAFLGFPPEPQELRERGIGHVVVNSTLDRPWSQYYLLPARRTTARSSRPIRLPPSAWSGQFLRPPTWCAAEPERVAQRLVDQGFTAELRLRAAIASGSAVPQMARLRPGGFRAVLRAAAPRGGCRQVQPHPDHRGRHRLALPGGDQAGAEGLS